MKIRLNENTIEYKLIEGTQNSVTIELNGTKYFFNLEDLKNDEIIISENNKNHTLPLIHTDNDSFTTNAFGSDIKVEKFKVTRKKELKTYAPSIASTGTTDNKSDDKIIAAIGSALIARQGI